MLLMKRLLAESVPIDEISLGERDRTELGDVRGLADSIIAVGLLHPVVVTESGELVAGERRLAAVRELGWSDVPVTVVDLSTAADVLRAEADENTCRKPLTPYEASRARERRARVLAPQAKEAQARPGQPRSAKLAERSGETRKVAATGTGYSGSTLDKVDRIRDAAERGVVRHGKTEVPVPEPVQEVAREALAEVKVTGAAVDRAHTKVADALTQYVEEDPDIKNAKFRAAMWKAIKATNDLPLLDTDRAAEAADEDLWDALWRLREGVTAWLDTVEAKRPRSLRVVGMEK
jgi:ParB-like chromosome segregation protein Spo0J